MAVNTRNSLQRARDLEIIAKRYLKGDSQQAIANDLGVARSQVSYDVKKLIKMWQAEAVNDVATARAVELQRIQQIQNEVWEQWELSKKPIERSIDKRKIVGGDDEGGRKGAGYKEAGKVIQNRTANIAYMQTAQWCIEQRCKLLGIYAATKIDGNLAIQSFADLVKAAAEPDGDGDT